MGVKMRSWLIVGIMGRATGDAGLIGLVLGSMLNLRTLYCNKILQQNMIENSLSLPDYPKAYANPKQTLQATRS